MTSIRLHQASTHPGPGQGPGLGERLVQPETDTLASLSQVKPVACNLATSVSQQSNVSTKLSLTQQMTKSSISTQVTFFLFLGPQILHPQDFPRNPLETLQAHDPLAENLELELGLGTTTDLIPGTGIELGPALRPVLDLELGNGASLVPGFDFSLGVCMGASTGPAESGSVVGSGVGEGMSSVDPDAQHGLSLQDTQTPLDSRTTQRHGSDTGGN